MFVWPTLQSRLRALQQMPCVWVWVTSVCPSVWSNENPPQPGVSKGLSIKPWTQHTQSLPSWSHNLWDWSKAHSAKAQSRNSRLNRSNWTQNYSLHARVGIDYNFSLYRIFPESSLELVSFWKNFLKPRALKILETYSTS